MVVTHSEWLGIDPIFYMADGSFSSNSHFFKNKGLELSPVGVRIYLEYGMAAFGQTIFSGGHFLTPGDSLSVNKNIIQIDSSSDPILHFENYIQENEVLEKLRENFQAKFKHTNDLLIVPLSGGYDSRLILLALREFPRERIRTFTYGTSYPQKKSCEVIVAQEIARRENVRWNHIQLGNFLKFKDMWFDVMGPHVHSHGMYHIDFYQQIRELIGNQKSTVVSGLVGDLFAGKITIGRIQGADDLVKLNYSHGQRLPKSDLGKANDEYLEIMNNYLSRKREILSDQKFRVVELVRTKMILLRYLKAIPTNFSFDTYFPFCDIQIALSMLNLPEKRREKRLWQSDLFKANQLAVEPKFRNCLSNNSNDFQGILAGSLTIPNAAILQGLVKGNVVQTASKDLSPNLFERKFVLSSIGGSKKSAMINLFGVLSPTLKSYRYQALLDPLIRARTKD